MAAGKNKVIIYTDWSEIFHQLTDANAGKLIKHLFDYVTDKNPPEPTGILKMAWIPMQGQLKRDLKKWEQFIEKQTLNGQKGGRGKTQKTQAFKKIPKKAVTVTVTDTVTVKDNVNKIFKQGLLDFGFSEGLVIDWMLIRKNKKATNTQTAFDGFIKEVEKSGIEKNEVLRICVERSWSGFKAEWLKNTIGAEKISKAPDAEIGNTVDQSILNKIRKTA